jgi:hypothetical protein
VVQQKATEGVAVAPPAARRGVQPAEEQAVRQQQEVAGEPVAAEVGALPDVGVRAGIERGDDRPPADRAAGIAPAVGADQGDRAFGGRGRVGRSVWWRTAGGPAGRTGRGDVE